jgi:hypothetical protein
MNLFTKELNSTYYKVTMHRFLLEKSQQFPPVIRHLIMGSQTAADNQTLDH